MLYAVKALANMAMSSININMVIAEFGALDILLQIVKAQSQMKKNIDEE